MQSNAQKRGGFIRLFLFAAGACALLAACSGNSNSSSTSTSTSTSASPAPPPGGFPVFVNIPEPPTLVADFSVTPTVIPRDSGRSTYKITLNSPVPPGNPPLTFTYKTTEISSGMEAPVENPNDHRVDGSFIIGPGSRSDILVLDSHDPAIYDGSYQTITLTLNPLPTNADGVQLQLDEDVSGAATVTIIDERPEPTRVVGFSAFPGTITNNGQQATVTVLLDRELPTNEVVLYFPYTLSGAVDFAATGTPTSGNIIVHPGRASGSLTITSGDHVGDRGAEGVITVTLGALPKNGDGLRMHLNTNVSGVTTVTIADTVPRPTLVADFSAAPASVAENGSDSIITLRLNHPIPAGDGHLSFPYTITGGTGYYVPIRDAGVIRIEEGGDSGSFTITSRTGGVDLGNQRVVSVALGSLPQNGDGVPLQLDTGVSGIARLTIVNSDTPRPTQLVGFFVDPAEISISGGLATVRLALDRHIPAQEPELRFPYRMEYDANWSDFTVNGRPSSPNGDMIVSPRSRTATLTINTTHLSEDAIPARDLTIILGAFPRNAANTLLRRGDGVPDRLAITISQYGGQSRTSMSRQIGSLAETFALSTANAHAGMIVEDVRRRINAADPPQKTAVGLARLPDQGGVGDLLPAMSLHTGGTLDSGHRYAMWLKPLTQTISAGTGSDLSGGDMTGAGLGIEWQSADGRLLQGLTASLMSSGMAVSGGPVRGAEWSEDMIVVAPYAVRRSGSANLWLSGGIGAGSAALAGAGAGSGDGESRLTFINGGAEWSGAVFSGPQMTVEAQGSLIRKDISGFRLKETGVPNVSAGIARTEGAAVMHWPLGLADGVIAPHMALDFSADAGDVLPGHNRHAAALRSNLNWSRDALSVFAQASRALSGADAAAATDDLSAGMRLELWEDVGLNLEAARESAAGDDPATVHRARIAGHWTF